MSDRADELAARYQKLEAEMASFTTSLSPEELTASTGGSSVGEVMAHLRQGAPEVISWLAGAIDAVPATGHGHGHGHGHGLFRRSGSGSGSSAPSADDIPAVLGALTTDQLDSRPPAAPGITDGSETLYDVLDTMLEHQAEHLADMRRSVATLRTDADTATS